MEDGRVGLGVWAGVRWMVVVGGRVVVTLRRSSRLIEAVARGWPAKYGGDNRLWMGVMEGLP